MQLLQWKTPRRDSQGERGEIKVRFCIEQCGEEEDDKAESSSSSEDLSIFPNERGFLKQIIKIKMA